MNAIDDFAALLETTDVMKQILKSLKEEPAYLLGDVCREYEKTGQSVPDHRLQFGGYMGETSLNALLTAGLIRRQPGGILALYLYEPTQEGQEQYNKLKASGFYKK